VRKHPSPPTRRGNRIGHGRVSGDQWAGAGSRGPSPAMRVRSVVEPKIPFCTRTSLSPFASTSYTRSQFHVLHSLGRGFANHQAGKIFYYWACFTLFIFSKYLNQTSGRASLGILQSPRGDKATDPTLGPSGIAERLNCCAKNRW